MTTTFDRLTHFTILGTYVCWSVFHVVLYPCHAIKLYAVKVHEGAGDFTTHLAVLLALPSGQSCPVLTGTNANDKVATCIGFGGQLFHGLTTFTV